MTQWQLDWDGNNLEVAICGRSPRQIATSFSYPVIARAGLAIPNVYHMVMNIVYRIVQY